ncbi:F0F1 ATP synthase subunit delta [Metamycoplasma arthritidis]|uniref:ATP synthase subunit delta n=1 Tax=Metamycoplasma arthritidis (strain 158L3-1) TaxID=243272 RepID=ATPD_META1|nr:F0F1 ATP synthase subunit delta [Metamycoplasma arthritidis]B3PLV5.1 RecName: Full=ATP synthase subunit delta; AltName: Full=ATP synthase F(1) sector subunit delta; AltName: Full=F-type ATPase subunit delta; Short=F-ATPase subunit delta [Metamycoplasma arthritidis 158L3-1]ACF07007.1 ATP synthase delta subunit [Metamycoplasma arthritidis 158L3-1]VEU78535.1 F0F1 ATP synthase subunit delta [Metamycoplasma arthritidis]
MYNINDLIYNWSFALFDLANDEGILKELTADVVKVIKVLKRNKRYLEILNSYNVDLDVKFQKIDEAFSGNNIHLINFIKLAAKAAVAKFLIQILVRFVEISNQKLNVKYGTIFTTIALDEVKVKEFESKISKKLNAKVILKNEIDPSLIAGIKIKIDDYVVENSISGYLNELKKSVIKK